MACMDLNGFSQIARDHATHPRHLGPLDVFNGHARITGPCGDTMEFWIVARNNTIDELSFMTDGCGSSIACGSMAVALANGRYIGDTAVLQQQDILNALDGLPAEFEHCARLAATTLNQACEDYMNNKNKTNESRNPHTTCDSCGDKNCTSAQRKNGESDEEFADRQQLQSRLCRIEHVIVVLSGKGGVGKSTVAVNLATALMMAGKRVGLLDVDIHGPSIPTMLGLEHETIRGSEEGLLPIEIGDLKVMSLGFLLKNPDDAVIWRGPMKMGVIKQFLKDVFWGDLDYLIIDSPPGTGDEPLSVCQLIGTLDGAVIVTTPQKVAAVDVRKSITFCHQVHVPVIGIVENMSGFACPKCGEITSIFQSGAGKQIAEDMGVPFLGAIPMDPQIAASCDAGHAFIHNFANSATAESMRAIIRRIVDQDPSVVINATSEPTTQKEIDHMRIAIPLASGKLTMHFGHCESFALIDVDAANKKILKREDVIPPPHEPGLLPPWLAERNVNLIIAGGMGQRAQSLFSQNGIEVIVGAPSETPEHLVTAYLAGTLQSGDNACDH